mmetsp:Transcript_101702/g.328159  ORF Transcript_101702/g.328159 Transcript_101702/m.328159 type:complete len:256 (+) Transcript_101702:668-1435(+)
MKVPVSQDDGQCSSLDGLELPEGRHVRAGWSQCEDSGAQLIAKVPTPFRTTLCNTGACKVSKDVRQCVADPRNSVVASPSKGHRYRPLCLAGLYRVIVQERYRKCRDGVAPPGVEDDHVRHVDHRQRVGAQGALQLEEVRLHEHNEVQAAVVKLLPCCHEVAPPLSALCQIGATPGDRLPADRNEHSAELKHQLFVGLHPLFDDVRVRQPLFMLWLEQSGQISEPLEDLLLVRDEALGAIASTTLFAMRTLGNKF